MGSGDRLWSRMGGSNIINNDVLDLIGGRPPPPNNSTVEDLSILGERALLHSGRSSLSSGGDLRSLRGETFAPFGGRPLIPSGETLAALQKTLNHIRETLAPLGGELCSPWGDICSLRGRPLLPSGGGLCSPSCSVEAGMVSLPHSCRVIRLRTLPGCDMEPGLASGSSEAGKCGACA